MARGPHNRSTDPLAFNEEHWELLDDFQREVDNRVSNAPNGLADAKAVLRTCLVALAATKNPKLKLSGDEILDILFECVGPGCEISVGSEKLAEVLARRIGNGIPAEDGKCVEFRVADIWYRLTPAGGVPLESKREPDGTWLFGVNGAWSEILTDQAWSKFLGRGESREAAAHDWRYRVHRRFQQLVRSRPFRMSEDEKADWAILSKLIDVEQYWKKTPIKQQETGWVSTIQSGNYEITWLGSETTEAVGLEHVPPEFASFGEGQWFEALVERKRDNYSLNKVIHARPIDPIKEMTDEEMKEWFSSLPTTETLPKSDTDWNTF